MDRAVTRSLALVVLVSVVAGTVAGEPGGRDDILADAEALLDPARTGSAETPNFRVRSYGVPDGVANALASNLEIVFSVLDGLLQVEGWSPAVDREDKVSVFLFGSRAGFVQFVAAGPWRADAQAEGFYAPSGGFLVFHLELQTRENVRHVMLHECVHAWLDHRLAAPEVVLPLWLHEGLAEFVALSDFRKGRIRYGVFCSKTVHHDPIVVASLPSYARVQAVKLRKAARKRPEMLAPDALFAVEDPDQIEDHEEFYGVAWLWVAFLQDVDDGKRRFPVLLARIADGESPAEALKAVYGRLPGDFTEDFAGYVREFRTLPCH